jgi:DNA end-binding protein Ku
MAARSLWNGTVSFGLVNVPVKLYSAVEDKTVHFQQVHVDDGARIEYRRFCSKEDAQVDNDEIVKGYELSSGEFVELTKEEIDAAAGDRAHVIEVDAFVSAGEIDPIFYEKTYYLGAGDKGEDAHRLLHDALEGSGRVAVGRFTFPNREYLAAIRPLGKVLALHTMRFADELADPSKLKLPRVNRKPSEREIKMASALVEGLYTDFDPKDYKDAYRTEVLKVVKRKAAGKEIEPPEEPETEPSDDLAAALEASLGSKA